MTSTTGICASKSFCRRGRPQLADFHPPSLWLEVALVGDIVGWRCLWLEVGEQSAARRGKRTELWFEVYLWLKEGPSAARRSKEGPGQLEEGRHWALS